MTAADLTKLFQAAGVKPGALRKWAKENFGVEIPGTVISKHLSGVVRISPGYEVFYKIFFTADKPGNTCLKKR